MLFVVFVGLGLRIVTDLFVDLFVGLLLVALVFYLCYIVCLIWVAGMRFVVCLHGLCFVVLSVRAFAGLAVVLDCVACLI